ncbi:MAG: alpha/beta hydrolase [Proteobacteria bacterium]|nr:alpha/beta hydrolase [Pseudomonadota bacterium]
MIKSLLDIVKILVLLLVVGSILIYFFQESLIFFPQKTAPASRARFSKYEISINNNGIVLRGWFLKSEPSKEKPLIIYYGGNAEEVSGGLWEIERFHTRSFLFMNYRGYGDSQGKPTEENLLSDALVIFDHISKTEHIDSNSIVLMGRSLGSGVATYVARHRKVRGVILVTPFDSLLNVAKHHYPFFPVRLLLKHRFDSAALAPEIDTPVINIMGGNDGIIPNRYSLNLMRQWKGSHKSVAVNGATHNDIAGYDTYWRSINEFMGSLP